MVGAEPNVAGAKPGSVGGEVVRLLLRLPLCRSAATLIRQCSTFRSRWAGLQPSGPAMRSAISWAASTPRSSVSIEMRVRRVRMSSRCSAPSWVTAYSASTRR